MRKRADAIPLRADAVVELSRDRLWKPAECARYLGVSEGYLRASSCPKKLLPGTGHSAKPLVRYDPAEVEAWVALHSAHARRFA